MERAFKRVLFAGADGNSGGRLGAIVYRCDAEPDMMKEHPGDKGLE